MASIISLSAGSTIARASSGSRSSISSMELLMSAKSIVTVLRSPSSDVSEISALTRIDVPASGARPNLPASSSGFAHSMQNLAVREFSVPQEEQRRVNGDAHSPQNFARSGLSAPQFQQRIALLLV